MTRPDDNRPPGHPPRDLDALIAEHAARVAAEMPLPDRDQCVRLLALLRPEKRRQENRAA